MAAKIAILMFLVPGVIFLIYSSVKDLYKHPLCPKCKDSLCCERNEVGRAICRIHGDVTDCDSLKVFEEE